VNYGEPPSPNYSVPLPLGGALQILVIRRAGKLGYYTGDFTITALCEQADEQLFRALKYNPIHPVHRLLPSERSTPYLTRSRVGLHNMSYPPKTAVLTSAILFTALYKVLLVF